MRSRTSVIAAVVAMLLLAACEDEPVSTLSVSFEPQQTVLTGRTGDEATVLLRPSYNIDPSDLRQAEWTVISVTGYTVDIDGDGESDFDIPEAETVSFSNASYFKADATFTFQGIYNIQVEVEDSQGRTGIGQVKVTVGDGTFADGYLPVGPVTDDG